MTHYHHQAKAQAAEAIAIQNVKDLEQKLDEAKAHGAELESANADAGAQVKVGFLQACKQHSKDMPGAVC